MKIQHLTSLYDLTPVQLEEILDRAAALKSQFKKGERPRLLPGYVLAQVFENLPCGPATVLNPP